jgi:DNA polymerase I-like protein with 3'-5' exonuclease and polymerase domains
MALAYIDWEAQEIAIAAALSKDENLKKSYLSGDPYLDFAKSVGLAPPDATKKTHWRIREACKVLMLGVNYGMSEFGLAVRLRGLNSSSDAADLLLLHKRHYTVYWAWSKSVVDRADLRGFIQTMFGWRMWVTDKTTARTLMNFPMQATGAEMMRIAAIALTEIGIQVCSIIHDAFMVQAPIAVIGAVTALAEGIMQEAGYRLLGFPVRTEATVICHPDRYMDERPGSAEMWNEVSELLDEIEAEPEVAQ